MEAILKDPQLKAALSAVVLCANDPVAAFGGVELLRNELRIEPAAVTGPATDNRVGVDIIVERLGVPAYNALSNGVALADHLQQHVGLGEAVTHD